MRYDFDKVIKRRNTSSRKLDEGSSELLPMWTADMDFEASKSVIDALVKESGARTCERNSMTMCESDGTS